MRLLSSAFPVRWAVVRTVVATAAILCLIALLTGMVANYPVGLGSDWSWYRNGIDRLADGAPLYDPRMRGGPFDYVAPELFGQYNQAPWLLPLVAPLVALAEPAARVAWTGLIAVALTTAFAVLWPRDLSRASTLLLAALLIASPPILMNLAWANLHGLVILGVALWIFGRRRSSDVLMAAGLYLASLKVAPAVPLVLMALRERRLRPVVWAGLAIGMATLGVSVLNGPDTLAEFLVIPGNTNILEDSTNLSPVVGLEAVLPEQAARAVSAALGLGGALLATLFVRNRMVALGLGQLAICAVVPNLYATWLGVPLLIGLAASQGTGALRMLDRVLNPFLQVSGGLDRSPVV